MDGYDSEEQAEILALGKAMKDPKKRVDIINKSINR